MFSKIFIDFLLVGVWVANITFFLLLLGPFVPIFAATSCRATLTHTYPLIGDLDAPTESDLTRYTNGIGIGCLCSVAKWIDENEMNSDSGGLCGGYPSAPSSGCSGTPVVSCLKGLPSTICCSHCWESHHILPYLSTT